MTAQDRVTLSYYAAIRDFRRARRRAVVQDLLARLTGDSGDLLSYDEVRAIVKADATSRSLKEIPLDAIVGSVGRYADFTRTFLPRRETDEERWARVKVAMTELGGLPPIEVYQIGAAYFVLDGNHRVSVARQLGSTTIEAYVTEIRTEVPLSPDDKPDDVIIKTRHADFMRRYQLDQIRPSNNLRVTAPGQYRILEEHIEIQRRLMERHEQRDSVSLRDAAAQWYDQVYLPVTQVIRERGILRDFPGRTETDLYVWLMEHRAALEEYLGWEIQPDEAASDLAAARSPARKHMWARARERFIRLIRPRRLEPGPPPGHWRREKAAAQQEDRLFREILVAVRGAPESWNALDQALYIAEYEGAHLRGLHVVESEDELDGAAVQAIKSEFHRRCDTAQVSGELAVRAGEVTDEVCKRARWSDLVVIHLAHPPANEPLARLGSGLQILIRSCSRPVLTVPGAVSALDRPLVAYDGSPKAKEALLLAASIAGKYKLQLTILSVPDGNQAILASIDRASTYLAAREVQADFVITNGSVADAILRVAEAQECDLIVMGGYGHNPVLEVVLGSTVDRVLRESILPTLICR